MLITYSPADSFLYRINPFFKGLFTMLIILMFSALAKNLTLLCALLAAMLMLAKAGRTPMWPIFAAVKKIWVLMIIVALIQGFSQVEFSWQLAFIAILRILGVFFAAGIFVTISSQSELMYFWEQAFRPFAIFGLPARELALVMVIAVRFLPVILGEIDRIRMAQMARGAKFTHGFGLKAVKSLMPLLVPTISLAIIRAGDLALAMEARGYCVSRERTRYHSYRIGFVEVFLLMIFIAAFYLLLFSTATVAPFSLSI